MHLREHKTAEHLDLMLVKAISILRRELYETFRLMKNEKIILLSFLTGIKCKALITCRLINRTIDFQGRKRSIPHHMVKFILPLDGEENVS